jgi:hypothetical protein
MMAGLSEGFHAKCDRLGDIFEWEKRPFTKFRNEKSDHNQLHREHTFCHATRNPALPNTADKSRHEEDAVEVECSLVRESALNSFPSSCTKGLVRAWGVGTPGCASIELAKASTL